MTSAHSTRNTSIRTRKIRGEDSLLSSISISEREEGPEGIASVIRYEKPRWRQYGTAGRIKKLGVLRFRDRPKWNRILRRAPISAPVGTAGCPTRIQIGNVVHRAVFRLRRAPGGEYDSLDCLTILRCAACLGTNMACSHRLALKPMSARGWNRTHNP